MNIIIECNICHNTVDSRECPPWKTTYCQCGSSGLYLGYDMGDLYINKVGDYEVISE